MAFGSMMDVTSDKSLGFVLGDSLAGGKKAIKSAEGEKGKVTEFKNIDSFRKLFPKFNIWEIAKISAASPDALSQYLKDLEICKKEVESEGVRLATQKEELEKRFLELQETIEQKFGVKTVQELESLKNAELAKIESLYVNIERLVEPVVI